MGWNALDVHQNTALTPELQDKYVYFVHSYFTDVPTEFLDVTAIMVLKSRYDFTGQCLRAQFHPENQETLDLVS